MNYIIQTENLTKRYGDRKALDNVNIKVREGTIYGLVGRNGAGKTTYYVLASLHFTPFH